MQTIVRPSSIDGTVAIPASKSHTIRAFLIAALAKGTSYIRHPLDSRDAASCVAAIKAFGAKVETMDDGFAITGVDGTSPLHTTGPEDVIDTGNSGTTLYLAVGLAATGSGTTIFTGDHQIRRRTMDKLLRALSELGAEARSTRNNGCAPAIIGGPLKGGRVSIECPTSQYLSSLLLAAPLSRDGVEIEVPLLYEAPYAEITLGWLKSQGIKFEQRGLEYFKIPGGQSYTPFDTIVPADFSSATFFACAPAITGGELTLTGLDMNDSQGDKEVFTILEKMGVQVSYDSNDSKTGIHLKAPGKGKLKGGTFDLNAIPDALPALAATATFASETVRLVNVPQARLKETDRIAVMAKELNKLGASVTELEDGLVIEPQPIVGGTIDGHDDHRVVMAGAIAALGAKEPITIEGSEAAAVTFPSFFELLQSIAKPGTVNR